MGYIYVIYENDIPVYVGQTTKSIEDRWIEHCNTAKRGHGGYLLHNKMHAHGLKNFSIKLLENTEQLNEQEKFWIKELKTHFSLNGYNLTWGGEQCSDNIKKKCYQYDIEGNFLKEYQSIAEAGRAVQGKGSNIIKVLQGKINVAYGYRWSLTKEDRLEPIFSNYTGSSKIISQYDLNNNLIKVYPSVHAAAEALGKSQGTISMAATGRRKTAYGYIWKYNT